MLQHYRQLIDDPVRLGAFQRAIAAVVRPGDVVADIGSGLGTYALFALQAGARRVFAVEDSPIVEVAREVIRANGGDGAITVLPGSSTVIEPPERCDVVIFEDYLTTLTSPHKVRVVQDLVARWLKPGGKLLPSRAVLWLAPVEDPEGHLAIDRFHWTGDRVFGIDFSPTRRRVFASTHSRYLRARALVSVPELLKDYDLATLAGPELSATRQVTANRDGVVHGLLLWFDLQIGQGWLGTGPVAPPSAWQQTLFPLETPLQVSAGAPLEIALQAAPLGEQLVWRWSVRVGERLVAANSLDGTLLRKEALALSRPEHVPAGDGELAVDRFILDSTDGARSVAAIAAALSEHFGKRFSDPEAAMRRVASVLARYA